MKKIGKEYYPTVTDTAILGFFQEYRFLSNFWPCEVKIKGITYPSSEHAYMAMKILDNDERKKIASLKSPAAAKSYGRQLKLRPDWDDIAPAMMFIVLCTKFKKNPALAQKLLDTGDKMLVEVNDWQDRRWGMHQDGKSLDGKNLLGKLLMAVRDELKND